MPEICPPVTINEVADILMKENQKLKYSLYGLDFDTGKIWCHYAVPVSVLPAGADSHPKNLYGVLIKTIPIQSIARKSETLHSAMVPPVALPLLTKMLDAHDAWESARWDLSRTNSMEAATKMRIAGRKYMRYSDDGLNEEEMRKTWPFDVESFEKDIAQKMVCDKCGLYRVKGDCNDYDEGTTDDGNVAVNPSVRWMNRKMESWATNTLDGVYARLSEGKMMEMLGEDSVNGGTFCWTIGTNEYFIIQRIEEDYAFESRDYIYMLWDGKREPVIVASFNSMPNSKTMFAVRSCTAGNPVGRNNMAALMWNRVADRGESDKDMIRMLLESAKKAGVDVAAENLGMMEVPPCTR